MQENVEHTFSSLFQFLDGKVCVGIEDFLINFIERQTFKSYLTSIIFSKDNYIHFAHFFGLSNLQGKKKDLRSRTLKID